MSVACVSLVVVQVAVVSWCCRRMAITGVRPAACDDEDGGRWSWTCAAVRRRCGTMPKEGTLPCRFGRIAEAWVDRRAAICAFWREEEGERGEGGGETGAEML
ncbi:hypothetical protein B0T19DRAFT_414691 [Cercophora scortea]|uniref:Secreted protein n=1 Tax=Cercophora scortea TaxID=314031 RepID=A0AAE0IVI8_9PEZI|nr:hypothetical protein B0T19DRAFT_414691 [Cercophora scortea]